MKLNEIKTLRESNNDYVVYRVSSPNTDAVYYGYSSGPDIKKAFLVGANRQAEPDRGDVRMINAAGGEDTLRFSMEDVFTDELDAWMTRNDLRARDNMSITGPSNFPTPMLRAAKSTDPDRVARWKLEQGLQNMTARQAMAAKEFSMSDLQGVVAKNPSIKPALIKDLDQLTYPDFKAKYLSDL